MSRLPHTPAIRERAAAWAVCSAGLLLAACGTVPAPTRTAEPPPVRIAPLAFEPTPAVIEPDKRAASLAARQNKAPRDAGDALAPDAVPRIERIATGFPNAPYEIKGIEYEPLNEDVPMKEVGVASWYGVQFHRRPASTGERFDMYGMTAAHPTMPLPSYAIVRNLDNGRCVVVRVNDRGPFVGKRIIDLSYAAARKLGISGLGRVEVERLTHADIRTGAWKLQMAGASARPASPAQHAQARADADAVALTETP